MKLLRIVSEGFDVAVQPLIRFLLSSDNVEGTGVQSDSTSIVHGLQ
jgi:hypothetical protein